MITQDSASKEMTDEPTNTDTLILLAKWAESAERYDDMANYMQEVTMTKIVLTHILMLLFNAHPLIWARVPLHDDLTQYPIFSGDES